MFIVPIEPMKPMEFTETGTIFAPPAVKRSSAFQSIFDSALAALNATQTASRNDAYRLAFGDVDDIGQVMINTLKAESMIQTTVQITSRVINAYKEIMNIQV
jgi:flagellar hook-basal body complex protein FliE